MPTYVRRNGAFVDKKTGEPMTLPEEVSWPRFQIIKPMPEYRSPIDGRLITTKHERREDLKRNGCYEYEPSASPTKGKIRNKAFAKKRGLHVSEEFR